MARRATPTIPDVVAALAPLVGWLDDSADAEPSRPQVAAAVRASARYLAAAYPGGTVELRVPPFVAVQLVAGADHRRGTPPNVVELDPRTWLRLVTGRLGWSEALAEGAVLASGARADISDLLPLDLPGARSRDESPNRIQGDRVLDPGARGLAREAEASQVEPQVPQRGADGRAR